MSRLNQQTFKSIVTMLIPHCEDVESRKALVTTALIGCRVLDQMDYSGDTLKFVTRLINTLLKYGDCEEDKPAIVALLEEIKERVGIAQQEEITEIVNRINTEMPTGEGSVTSQRSFPMIAGIVAIFALIIAGVAFVIFQPDDDSRDSVEPTVNGQRSPEITTGELGQYDLRLQYGGQDSFTVIANETSNVWGIRLSTTIADDISLTERFPDLQMTDYTLFSGACLFFEREGTSPVLPIACDTNQVLRIVLAPGEVFWFDNSNNLYANVILRQGEAQPRLCPHDNGSGSCDLSNEE